jgi:ketosteroid isomerase-like protein
MNAPETTRELELLLQAYARAFEALDGARIADFYSVPCMSLRGDGSIHSYQSRQELESFFTNVAQSYKREGMHRSDARNLRISPIGGRCVLVTVDWVLYRADESQIRQWRQSYNLVRMGDVWRIMLSTFHVT